MNYDGNTISGTGQVNSASTGSGFSIDSIGSLMSDDIEKKDGAVRALLDQMDENNQQITEANSVLNSANLNVEISALTTNLNNQSISLSAINQNSYISQLINYYNVNYLHEGGLAVSGLSSGAKLTSGGEILNTSVLTDSDLVKIKSAVSGYTPSVVSNNKLASYANSILTNANAKINSLASGIMMSAADDVNIAALVNFYNANIITSSDTPNVMNGAGIILTDDVLTKAQLTALSGAVNNFLSSLNSVDNLSQASDLSAITIDLSTLTPYSDIVRLINVYNTDYLKKNSSTASHAVLSSGVANATTGVVSLSSKLTLTDLQNIQQKVASLTTTQIQSYGNSLLTTYNTDGFNSQDSNSYVSLVVKNGQDVQLLIDFYNNNIFSGTTSTDNIFKRVTGAGNGPNTSGMITVDASQTYFSGDQLKALYNAVSTFVNSNTLPSIVTKAQQTNASFFTLSSLDPNSYIARLVSFYNSNYLNLNGAPLSLTVGSGVISPNTALTLGDLQTIQAAVSNFTIPPSANPGEPGFDQYKAYYTSYASYKGSLVTNANSVIQGLATNASLSPSNNSDITALISFYNTNVIRSTTATNAIGGLGAISLNAVLTKTQLSTISSTVSSFSYDINRQVVAEAQITPSLWKLFNVNTQVIWLTNPSGQSYSSSAVDLNQLNPNSTLIKAINGRLSGVVAVDQIITLTYNSSFSAAAKAELYNLTGSIINSNGTITGVNGAPSYLSYDELPTSAQNLLNFYSGTMKQVIPYETRNGIPALSQSSFNAIQQAVMAYPTSSKLNALFNTADATGSILAHEISDLTNNTIAAECLDPDSAIGKLLAFYNNHVATGSEKIEDASGLSIDKINSIKAAIKPYIDSLSATSQQTYLDIQQKMNAYNLAISSWTQILQALGRSLDEPLRSIG